MNPASPDFWEGWPDFLPPSLPPFNLTDLLTTMRQSAQNAPGGPH